MVNAIGTTVRKLSRTKDTARLIAARGTSLPVNAMPADGVRASDTMGDADG